MCKHKFSMKKKSVLKKRKTRRKRKHKGIFLPLTKRKGETNEKHGLFFRKKEETAETETFVFDMFLLNQKGSTKEWKTY